MNMFMMLAMTQIVVAGGFLRDERYTEALRSSSEFPVRKLEIEEFKIKNFMCSEITKSHKDIKGMLRKRAIPALPELPAMPNGLSAGNYSDIISVIFH